MPPRLGKPQRQHRIATILAGQAVTSQAQLVELLAAEGIAATQATVSRDLEEIGALKVRVPGGETVYGVPDQPGGPYFPADQLRRVLGEWLVELAFSGQLVILRTPPGSAHVVASALDRARLDGIVGTVAGDDTVLAVAADDVGGRALAGKLAGLAGLPSGGGPHNAMTSEVVEEQQ